MHTIFYIVKEFKLITYPHKSLKTKSKKVLVFENELKQIISQMKSVMLANKGIGLAGNQVDILQQIIIFLSDPNNPESEIFTLINPKIVSASKETTIDNEGCLSCPAKEIKIERAQKITVLGKNELNERQKIKAKNLLARSIQHEIDHINGKLILDYEIITK